MSLPGRARFNRRQFIRTAASLGGLGALGVGSAAATEVSLVVDPADPVAASGPAQWALQELADSLAAGGTAVRRYERAGATPAGGLCIVASGASGAPTHAVPAVPEALAIAPAQIDGRPVLLAAGHDVRGLVYALLELADHVQNAHDPLRALAAREPVVERPANAVRSVARLFTSDVEDKPWYNDREMWPHYLTMLATNRFNRFNLSFGIGYDFLRQVTDAYFLFAYPFLLAVPGYDVRVPQLPDAEREKNLAMLRFISEQTVARGLDFQLGIWMHGYQWIDSPNPNYTIAGLTPETHGPYCRDAIRALLKACPAIGGVTFRIHGESGVQEGSYLFWKTVFEGVATCGRTVEIDMHAKGMDQTMLDLAVATGLPVKISPKYWAEHMGMPYHQASIRELERPRPGEQHTGLMKLSAGSRSFLRYGYGDLLREDRRWGVLHRIWPGTQRLLLQGDPLTVAAHSRAFSFCGSAGVEILEPLSFKGRRGSGIAGDRCGYADVSLRPKWDWEKYAHTFRIWGRLTYNPDATPECWRRYLSARLGAAAPAIEAALASASRILPMVTTAHAPSAANNSYWPEMYFNQSIVDPTHYEPYSDTPAPRVFGNVSPLDPQLFSRINDFADELLEGVQGARYSPVEVAQWIEDYAGAAAASLAQAESLTANKAAPDYRHMATDITIQAGLGRFFAAKFRAGVLYRIYERSGDRRALQEAVTTYRKARTAWAELAEHTRGVYLADITVGELPQLRGHWLDRLPAIDDDIMKMATMAKNVDQHPAGEPEPRILMAVREALGRPHRVRPACLHTPPTSFVPGRALGIEISTETPASIKLLYRHVNQSERFETLNMDVRGNSYRAAIPAEYTNSPFPLQYYFEVRKDSEHACIYPGFTQQLDNQPYYVVRTTPAR